MRFHAGVSILLFIAACGGGGSSNRAELSGTLLLPAPIRQTAGNLAHAEPFDGSASGSVAGMAVFRHVAEAPGHLAATVTGSVEGDVSVCLHSLDTGRCGSALEVVAGEVVDFIVTGEGRFRIDIAAGTDTRPRALPAGYWKADPFRAREIVVSPAAGWSAAGIAAVAGVECLADTPGVCLLRAAPEDGDEPKRLRRLLARCARMKAAGLVRFAEPNYERRLTAVPNDPLLAEQWSLEQIRVQGLWNEGTGTSSAIVAVVDTGIVAAHPDLAGRLVDGWDFIDNDSDPNDSTRDRAHGTMVAGIAAAGTDNGKGVAGIAWSGRIMPLRVFNASGTANIFGIAQAIRYAAGLDNSSGRLPARQARVVNLSFAGVVRTQSEEEACNAARQAGTLPVAASGNDGTSRVRYPAAYGSVLAVAATTREGMRADYSSHGSWLSLAAPGGTQGDGIMVADRDSSGNFVYRRTSGSSFASPHVSGVAALLMELGSLAPDEVQELLEATARDVGPAGRDDDTGWGILDAHSAALALLNLPAPAIIPGESLQVRLLRVSDGAELVRTITTDSKQFAWSFSSVLPGRYRLIAGTDRDFDGRIDDMGELFGAWNGGADLIVAASESRTDLSITIQPR